MDGKKGLVSQMKKIIVADKFDPSYIFRPSFINAMQSKLLRVMKKYPKEQKFRMILEPIPDKNKNVVTYINDYLEKMTQEHSESLHKILESKSAEEINEMCSDWFKSYFLKPLIEEVNGNDTKKEETS